MELYMKAKKILSTDNFDRKRYLAAKKLYEKAVGREKSVIGQLMESQIASVDNPKDVMWLNSLP